MASFDTTWDVNKYYSPHEPAHHWELRKKFMEMNKDRYPEERLVCLAQTFANIEFMGCRYPKETMELVEDLAFGIVQEYRESQKSRLKRTFVSGSDAAGAKVNRGSKRPGRCQDSEATKAKVSNFFPPDPTDPLTSLVIVIREWIDNQNSASILYQSASFSRIPFRWDFESVQECSWTCKFYLRDILVAQGKDSDKKTAKSKAADEALKVLKPKCYTIRIKQQYCSDGSVVSPDSIPAAEETYNSLNSNNVGHRLMKMMGWSGSGGLGKDETGISKPISVQALQGRSGLGSSHVSKELRKQLTQIIENYAKSENPYDLVFSSDLTMEQRKLIHQIALRFSLKTKSFGKAEARFVTLTRKTSFHEVIQKLFANGGNTDNFTLTPPSSMKDE